MLAGLAVQVYAALHANPLAIRLTDQVDRQIQQKIIPNGSSEVYIAILGHHLFIIKLLLRAAFENIKLLEFRRKLRPERIKAAITLAVNLCFKFCLQEQSLARARKSIPTAQVVKLQVRFDEDLRIFHFKIAEKSDGFVEKVSNVSAEGMMYFFHSKLQFTNLALIITFQN